MRTKKRLRSITAGLCVLTAGILGSTTAFAGSVTWSGATTITSSTTQSGQTYTSTTADQNALLINTSGTVNITNPTVSKSGGTSASDDYSFYGINSGIMVKGGGTVNITGGTVTTTAAGANGVFSYGANSGQTNATGDGTTVNISGTTITTTGNGSGGIMTTYGGTTVASNLTVTTSGGSSAPIRTDRGGGWVTVTGGTYTSSGTGSPAIYSTADVSVSDATLVSNKSEGVCIEGNGSIELTNCSLTASNTQKNGNAQYYDTIMIYQSMSGDATGVDSVFSMTGGTLTSNNGHVFHVTNTSAEIDLAGVTIVNNDSDGVLLSVVNDGWSGNSNIATVNASGQTLEGDIIVSSASSTKSSSASSLTLNLADTSNFTGSITDGSGSNNFGSVAVTVGSGSLWTLTSNSYVTSISGAGYVDYNGYTLYVNGTAYTEDNPYSGVNVVTDDTIYTDVSESDWFYESVMYVYNTTNSAGTSLMSGYSSGKLFGPYDCLTRSQFATILYRYAGEPSVTFSALFSDLEDGWFYSDAVVWAKQNSVINGYENGYFGVTDNITREQLATILYNYAVYAGLDTSAVGDLTGFTDVDSVSSFAEDAISWAVGSGVINGKSDGTLIDPQGTATRAECAAMIMNFVEFVEACEAA